MFATLAASGIAGMITITSVSVALRSQLDEHVPSVQAAAEVKLAMLEQRGNVSAYILDNGNGIWIDRLEEKKEGFVHWLEIAKASANEAEEFEILKELELAYRAYDDRREDALRSVDQGNTTLAIQIVLVEIPVLYEVAKDACDRLLDANTGYMQQSVDDAYQQSLNMGWVTGSCLAVGLLLAFSISGILTIGVFRPLHQTAVEARQLALIDGGPLGSSTSEDLHSLPQSLRSIAGTLTTARVDLQQSQAQLQHALKLASVGRIAAEVAHEIRSLLTTMNFCMYMEHTKESSGLHQTFATVHSEMRRLERNFTEFLNFARSPAPQFSLCSVAQLIETSVALISPRITEKQLAVQQDLDSGLPAVCVDSDQIGQVLVNLLTNACDAAPRSSQLTIIANTECHVDGRRFVIIRVCNQGTEIPEAIRDRVFEPYFTTKPSGTGLGLAICETITRLNDGQLQLESSSAAETVFLLRIPHKQ
ncbi:hypothetical protein GCM10023156_23180 [Novipirellula rosea]|uniref:histidine kinase n=2 Tax=Novipirellula rosea TaxID=1031540 RepID=A0ABP8MR85_9BACT